VGCPPGSENRQEGNKVMSTTATEISRYLCEVDKLYRGREWQPNTRFLERINYEIRFP
jgi:hypothetical protein